MNTPHPYSSPSSFTPFFLYSLLLHIVFSTLFLVVENWKKPEPVNLLQVTLHTDPFITEKKTKGLKTLSAPKKSKKTIKFAEVQSWSKPSKTPTTLKIKKQKVPGFLRAGKFQRRKAEEPEWVQKIEQKKRLEKEKTKTAEKKESAVKETEVNKADQTKTETNKANSKLTNLKELWQKKQSYKAYYATLEQMVKSNWVVPGAKIKDYVVIVRAVVDSKGNLLEHSIIQSSGSQLIDNAAEKAVTVSAPFPEFPKSFDPDLKSIPFQFRFYP